MFEFIEKIKQLNSGLKSYKLPYEFDIKQSYIIYGDNEFVLNSLLNDYFGKIDLIYIDPPFNTNQIFEVSQNRSNAISRKKTGQIAYSDDMKFDDFLLFMYLRFNLMYKLLSDKGSLYVHIDDKTGPYFKIILDEIFGAQNFKNEIVRIKSNPKNFDRKAYGNEKDIILFYAKNHSINIWNEVKIPLSENELIKKFPKIDKNGRRYNTIPLHAPGESSPTSATGMPWRGMLPPEGRHWRTNPAEFDRLDSAGDIEWSRNGNPRIKKYSDEHKGMKIQDIWSFKDPQYPKYPTEKNLDMLDLIIKQSSNVGSIVMDCFAGSGTTLLAAARNKRTFIGIDSSKIAIEVEKQKLSNYVFNFIDTDILSKK